MWGLDEFGKGWHLVNIAWLLITTDHKFYGKSLVSSCWHKAMAHTFSFESHFDESNHQSCYDWRTLRSCVGGIELLVLVQNIWMMQLKLWLRKEKSDEFSYCIAHQHFVSISYAIEPCQRKKSRKDPLQNNFFSLRFWMLLIKKIKNPMYFGYSL